MVQINRQQAKDLIGFSRGKIFTTTHTKKDNTIRITVENSDDDFIFDPIEYMRINLKSKPLAIVHSHPDCSSEPSEGDRKNCNIMNLNIC